MTKATISVRTLALGALLLVLASTALTVKLVRNDGAGPPVGAATPPESDLKRPVLSDELAPLRAQWGPARFSSHNEELLVRDFFSDMRDGFFVDIGAGHYRERSNTYFLETKRGWSGIAIDPQPDLAAGYQKHRPRTKFFTMFVSDVSDEKALLHIGNNNLFSSADAAFTKEFTDVSATIEARTVKLDDLLAAGKVEKIDFVSLDVELHEPQVLAGFNLRRYLPRLVCVEAHPQVRQQILDYFARRNYVIIARYLRADPQNLWFRPLPE
jgi:FkbM family methyltransferase